MLGVGWLRRWGAACWRPVDRRLQAQTAELAQKLDAMARRLEASASLSALQVEERHGALEAAVAQASTVNDNYHRRALERFELAHEERRAWGQELLTHLREVNRLADRRGQQAAETMASRHDDLLRWTGQIRGALEAMREQLVAAGAEIAARVDTESRAALDRVFESPATYWGGQLSRWMAEPAGEAVRYAVQKSARDASLTDNTQRRREAVQWAKRWLLAHHHEAPPDSQLGFMVEAAVLEGKARRPRQDGRPERA